MQKTYRIAAVFNWKVTTFGERLLQMRTHADRHFGMTSADIASAPFTYETLEGRGLGVIAARDIEPGERLLAEAPLLVARIDGAGIPLSVLQSSVDNLAAEDRAKFFELSQNAGYGEAKTADGIAQTNGMHARASNGQPHLSQQQPHRAATSRLPAG